MRKEAIFISWVNPLRLYAEGGSEDIRRRILGCTELFRHITVYAIDSDLRVTDDLEGKNVTIKLYKRHIDPRPWRWLGPLPASRRYNRDMMRDIIFHLSNIEAPDVIFFEGLQLTTLWIDIQASISKNTRVILRMHNIESDYHRSISAEHYGFKWLAHKIVGLQYSRCERSLLGQFDFIYALSVKEMETLKARYSHLDKRLRLVLPIPGGSFSPRMDEEAARDLGVIAYYGDLGLINNSAGLHWFCREVMPRLSHLNLDLHVAGKGGEAFEKYSHVTVFGYVKSIQKFLSSVGIIIAPITSGGGVKIKVLDAMSFGIPVITTAKGAEGLPSDLVSNLFIGNNVSEWCKLIQFIFDDYETVLSKTQRAARLLDEKYDVGAFARRVHEDLLYHGSL